MRSVESSKTSGAALGPRRSTPATARAARQREWTRTLETHGRPWRENRGYGRNGSRPSMRGKGDESREDDGDVDGEVAGQGMRSEFRRGHCPASRPRRSCLAVEPDNRPPYGPCKRVAPQVQHPTKGSPTRSHESDGDQRSGRKSLTWRHYILSRHACDPPYRLDATLRFRGRTQRLEAKGTPTIPPGSRSFRFGERRGLVHDHGVGGVRIDGHLERMYDRSCRLSSVRFWRSPT
jgi:hypothetical protein